MPRVLILPPAQMYTVDRAVGRNAPNDRLDVLLVQFLLFLSTNNPWWDLGNSQTTLTVRRGMRVATPVLRSQATSKPTLSGTHPKPQGDIVIDGICGDQTIGFIEYFQEQMQLYKFQECELNGQVVPWKMQALTMPLLNHGLRIQPQAPMLDRFRAFPQELWDSFYL
jgi:hypothetical protein